MARKTGADSGDVISRLADSGEDAVRTLIAFPLRMLVGALDIVDAQVHRAADTLREIERVVDLEGRAGSPEKHTRRRRQGSRTTAERVEPGAGRQQEAPGSDAAAGHSGA
jgi:hypothetical protein